MSQQYASRTTFCLAIQQEHLEEVRFSSTAIVRLQESSGTPSKEAMRPRLGAPSSLPRQPCTTRLQHVRRWLSLLGMCSAAMQRRNPGWRHLRGVRRDSEAGFAGQQYACRERAGRCVACSPTDPIAHSHLKLLLRVFHWASSDDQLDGAAREAPDRGAGVSGQTPWGAVTAILREVMIAT
jgi:hypothetical protein